MPPVDAPMARISIGSDGIARSSACGPFERRTAGGSIDAWPSAFSLPIRISENFPLKRPVPGFGMVSAAPSASAATVSSAPSSASEETIMTLAPPAAAMIRGIDLRPPAPGISRSRTTMSTRHSPSASMASSAVPATAVISNTGSLSMMRDRTARATVESSTIISRIFRPLWRGSERRSRDLASARSTAGISGDADELKLDVESLAVERLHDIFVRTGLKGGPDMSHVILGGAEHDLRLFAVAALPEQTQKLHAAHHRHVPIEQDDVRHLGFAAGQRFLAVTGFFNLEIQRFKDVPSDLPDHLGVVDDQTAFHA